MLLLEASAPPPSPPPPPLPPRAPPTRPHGRPASPCPCRTSAAADADGTTGQNVRLALAPQFKTAATVGLLHLVQGMMMAWWLRESLEKRVGSPPDASDGLVAVANASLSDATTHEDVVPCSPTAPIFLLQYCAPLPCIAGVSSFLRLVDRKMGGYLLGVPHFLLAVVHNHAKSNVDWQFALILLNMCTATTAVFTPVFLSEIVMAETRAVFQYVPFMSWYVGFYTAIAVLTYSSRTVLCTIAMYVVLTYFMAFSRLPETPVFLVRCRKTGDAIQSLQYYRGRVDVGRDFKKLCHTLEELESMDFKGPRLSFEILREPGMRYALFCVIALCVNQQMVVVGLPVSVETLFRLRHSHTAIHVLFLGAILIGLFVGAVSADVLGRKFSLIYGYIMCGIGLFYMGMTGLLVGDPDMITELGALTFLFGFSHAIAVLPIVITTEIFSPKLTSCMVALFVTTTWAMKFTWALQLWSLELSYLDPRITLFLVLICVGSAIFTWLVIPETKRKPLDEIVWQMKNQFIPRNRSNDFKVYTLTLTEI